MAEKNRWWPARAAEEIGVKVIAEHYRSMLDQDIRVVYLFRSEQQSVGGALAAATIAVIKGRNATLAAINCVSPEDFDDDGKLDNSRADDGAFYVIEIHWDTWKELSQAQRVALIDHELMHAFPEVKEDGTVALRTRPHDIEVFGQEIARHGLWNSRLQRFGRIVAPHVREFLAAIEAEERALLGQDRPAAFNAGSPPPGGWAATGNA